MEKKSYLDLVWTNCQFIGHIQFYCCTFGICCCTDVDHIMKRHWLKTTEMCGCGEQCRGQAGQNGKEITLLCRKVKLIYNGNLSVTSRRGKSWEDNCREKNLDNCILQRHLALDGLHSVPTLVEYCVRHLTTTRVRLGVLATPIVPHDRLRTGVSDDGLEYTSRLRCFTYVFEQTNMLARGWVHTGQWCLFRDDLVPQARR